MAGGTPLGQMYIELGLDVSKFNPSLTSAKNAVKYFQNNVKALDSTLKNNGKSTELLKAKYKSLGQAIEAQKKVLDQMKQNFDKLDPGSAKFDKAAADIERENAKLSAMEGQLYKVEQALKAVGRENSFSGKMEALGKNLVKSGDHIQTFGKKVSDFGGTLTKGVSAPLIASAGFALKAAIDYETAFAGVKKTVDGTPQQFDKLSASIREMAKEMPSSAVEIANVAEAAGQLGVPIGAIKDFSKTMINLGVSTNLSSEEAASSIAKIGNIMQVSGKDLGTWSAHFGSAVVDLGNHFATTERDIVEMTNRLAAGGKLAGLTTPEILGLATAMSSVGIEAEAGGTAMNQTLTGIGKAVAGVGKGAKEKLQLIASTAGMTAEQFSTAWKQKPAEALQAFIKGLQKAHEEGKNMDGILAELDMSGIRQGNMLKSLASASDKMGEAVRRSNSAWKENTALTTEAQKRYETTESQLKIFKNQITDLAIEFGGPLLKAMNSGLQAAKPWIQKLADMAKAFSEMSESQQQNIIKWGLLAAGAGPALSILGKGIGVIGGITKGIGFLTQGIGKVGGGLSVLGKTFELFKQGNSLSSAFKTATTGITATGAAAESAATSTSLWSKALGFLTSPAGWITGGLLIGGVATKYALDAQEAEKRTHLWGTAVNELQSKELSGLYDKVQEAKKAMVDFGAGSTKSVEEVRKSVQSLGQDITDLVDKNTKKKIELAEKLGLSKESQQAIAEGAERTKTVVNDLTSQITDIYQRASDQHRNITREEQQIITANQNELINIQLKNMKYSGAERVAITKAINGEISGLNREQAQRSLSELLKWMADEKKAYDDRKKILKDAIDSIKGTDAESVASRKKLTAELQQIEADHNAKMEAYGVRYAQLVKKFRESGIDGIGEQVAKMYQEAFEKTGLSFEEFEKKAIKAGNSIQQTSSLWAHEIDGMSEKQIQANTAWNSMVWDLKEGKVKTNALDIIKEAASAEDGWNQMEFLLKNANLETNAKMMIGQALVEVDKWNTLTPEQKELVVGNNQGMKAVLDSKTLLEQYNAMPAAVKELLMKNTDFLSSGERATAIIERWNTLTPEQKELILKDAASDKAERVRLAVDSLTGMAHVVNLDAEDKTKSAIASAMSSILTLPTDHKTDLIATPDGVTLGTNQAMGALGLYNGFAVPTKQITADPSNANNAAQQAINKQQEWNSTPSPVKPQLGDPTGAITAARQAIDNQNAWNATPSPTKSITGDSTSAVNAANSATNAINGIPTSHHTTITATEVVNKVVNSFSRVFGSRHEKGTNFHEGGLAMVNDQRNAVYKEMVTLPDGSSFIPDGRDVVLNLPRGSKVLRADRTKRLMKNLGFPRYAAGVGIPEDAKFLREIKNASKQFSFKDNSTGNSYSGENIVAEIAILRASLEKILTAILEKPSETYLDGDVLAQNSYQRYSKIMAREGI
ncbi:phage tail tape measure protein [Streptococcus sp. SP8]|uniref:phage tail tape measure protein n=1 Tax=Streptococcus sp. SP8 TaxID=3018252 RepID=UPI00263D9724|nr:phage tail tape measure protein [Streptococcus sp. SP8]MDN5031920.1 phage tail tape measure protein [Streptococcus sp. SP8]